MVETLIERLRNADTNSQQRVLGSRIFGEAADLLEALEREKEELRKERDRCHARLEIDHCFKLGDDDNLIRHEIPLNERSSFPDGITARDETIKLVERRAETAERQLAERDADLARLRVVISECASALGNGAHVDPRCTIEFMEMLPQEIRLHVAALAGSGDGWRHTCATEGCDHKATIHFERGGIGSYYCHDCYMRIQSLPASPSTAGER